MEEFSFTPDAVQNNVTPNDVSEFSFTPDEVQPDLTKVGAHNIFSLDGSNTNAAKKLNLVNRSWVEKFAQSDLGKFGDTQSKAVVRGLFDIAGGLGTMIRFYGDNMILPKGAFDLDDKTIDRINTFGRCWQKFGSSIKKGSDFVLNSKTLELDKDIFAGDIIDNPSVTRVSSAIMSAAPSLLGMVGMVRATGSAGLAYFVMGGVDSADVYEKAKETGKTQEAANLLYTSSQAGTALIDRMLSPLEKIMGNSPSTIWKKISQKIASGLSEGSAEGAQTVWQNAVKKYGIDDTQSLMDGVIEAAIGGFGSGALAAGTFNTAAERLKEKGATNRDIENISQAAIDYVQKHPDEINNIAFQQLNKGLDEFDKFVETHKGTPEAQKALQTKADLEQVYNKVFDRIKTSDTDKVAAAQAKVVQGVALWGSQELGISPLEYFEQRFPRIERVAYRDFARRLNEAKRAGEVAEINLYEALKNPALLKGQKVKDTRQSLTQFLKQNGGLKDFGGELKAMDADKQVIGLINNKNGRNLDDMALAAWEAGYFPQSSERPTVNELLDAIGEELGGRKRYNEEAPYSLEDEVNQLAEDLDRINIDWRNMEAPEIEMAVDAYMERQRAYNEKMGQEDIGSDELPWFQGQIADHGRGVELTINSSEEMQGLSDEDFKNKMLDTLKSFKGNKIFNQSLNGDIEIRTSSIKKYKSFFADKNKRLIVPYIPELLGKAKFIREESYIKASEPNIKAYYKANLPINIDEDNYNAHLTVREDQYGNFFWDAQIKEEPQHATPATNPGDTGLTSELSEDGLSISQTSENVNNPLYQLPSTAYKNGKADVNSEAFKAWFGDSKVVDENGQPKTYWHGSLWNFDTFKQHNGDYNFSPDEKFAYEYAESKAFEQGIDRDVVTYPVYIKSEKPFDFDNTEDIEFVKKITDGKKIRVFGNEKTQEEFIDEIQGYYQDTPLREGEFEKITQDDFPKWYSKYNENINYNQSSVNEYKVLEVNEREGYFIAAKPPFRVDIDDVESEIKKKIKDIDFGKEEAAVEISYETPYGPRVGNAYVMKVYKPSVEHRKKGADNWIYLESAEIDGVDLIDILKENGYDGYYKVENGIKNLSVFSPNQIKSVYNRGTFDPSNDNIYYQLAFAGSRVDYDTPSLEAIGSGEGNQVHGWGLYYALNKDVAEGYRYKFITEDVGLTGDVITEIDRFGKERTKKIYKDKLNSYKNELDKFNKEHTAEEIKEDDYLYLEKSNLENSIQVTESLLENIDNYTKGQVHEVDIPENPYLLDEQELLSKQPPFVKKALKAAAKEIGVKWDSNHTNGKYIYDNIANVLGTKKAASQLLEKHGIKGITYDGNQDGRCFVIFNPADVKVIQKFYQDGADTLYRDPKGAFSQRIDRRAVISLFERADASTFMHETAHFFFEELKAFAPTSEKSAQMLKTVNDWLGSDGASYTVEQTEQFARGFEQYLREGKAPSSYLKRVFDAFMNWMRNLYKTAKELNVKLNDEVRGVYGEILGGSDLDRYMDAPVAEVLGQTKRYWKAKREAMDDIYKQNVDAKKASARLFKRGRETMQNVYTDMRNYLSDAIVPLEEEIKQISPELYNMNRRLEIDKLQKTSRYYKRIKGFVDGMQKMDAPDFYTFDLALKNRDVDTVQRLLEKYALTDGFAEVRNILDDLREQMIDVGVDVAYMPDYFPRKIKDADGLLDYVEQEFGGRPEYSIIQKMIEEKRKDGRIRTKEDEAQIVNSLIRGYAGGISIAKIGNVKERSIDVVDQYMNRFYKVSTDALTDYISGAVQMIENKKYFGRETKELQNLRKMVANRETTIADYKAMEPKEAKWKEIKTRNYKIGAVEAQIRNTYDKDVKAELQDRKTKLEAEVEFLRNRRAEQVKEIAINRMEVELAQVKKEVDELADSKIENSVGNLLLEMAEQGKISHTQELRLKELLLARFSNQGLGNEFLRLLRDGGYIWTLGNFESAITQFGDLGTSAYKNGLWNTAFEYVKAWQGKSEITINDLGLEKIIQDGGYADTSAWSRALDKVLKYTGFEKMDKIAKQTLVNSAVQKARADAKAESPELEAYLRHEFGEKWVDVKEDLKTGAITDEIMEYAMFQLLDVQPITIDQMPRYYAEGGKKRLFYMMKSYFIKQLNEYRKICFETAKSNPRKAVVDMTRLTVYLMLFNAGADVLKDLLFGRPVNVPDSLVDNIFIGGSINRYQAMSVKREGLFKTLQKQLLFPVMLDELVVDILSDKEVKNWETWKNVPWAGRPWYWWVGGGHLKTLKEEKKARNERRNQRRRRRDD
jgi:hypothetical protein